MKRLGVIAACQVLIFAAVVIVLMCARDVRTFKRVAPDDAPRIMSDGSIWQLVCPRPPSTTVLWPDTIQRTWPEVHISKEAK